MKKYFLIMLIVFFASVSWALDEIVLEPGTSIFINQIKVVCASAESNPVVTKFCSCNLSNGTSDYYYLMLNLVKSDGSKVLSNIGNGPYSGGSYKGLENCKSDMNIHSACK